MGRYSPQLVMRCSCASTYQPSLLNLLSQRLAALNKILERLAQTLLSLAIPDLVPAQRAEARVPFRITSVAEVAGPQH